MNKRTICYVIGAATAILGMVLLLAVSDSLNTDILGLGLLGAGCIVGVMFTKTPAIAWRELMSYFVSPIAYILMAAYLVMVAFFFNAEIQGTGQAQMGQTFVMMTWLSLFMCPIITMRLLSEEARSGTLETVLTAPITDVELAVGKYAGAFLFYLILQAPTVVFVYILARQGTPDYGVVVSSYVGLVLMGALLISIGLLISAFTKNQVISAFVSFVAMFLLFFLGYMGQQIGGGVGNVIKYAGAVTHYLDFTTGVISSQHALYFITLSVLFLFFSVRAVESHRWR